MNTLQINTDGTRWWHNSNGELHREEGPAIEWASGGKAWYKHGKYYRENGPTMEKAEKPTHGF